jgi:Domain of unknown function (DUF4349)
LRFWQEQIGCKRQRYCRSLAEDQFMTTLAESLGEIKKPWHWAAAGAGILLIWAAIALPSLHRNTADRVSQTAVQPQAATFYDAAPTKAMPAAARAESEVAEGPVNYADSVAAGRKIIRTSSLSMVVQRPSEVAREIAALAEGLGGYVETANGGDQNATSGTLTIRVPATRFEQARVGIRKLGLSVENERVDAQDVTRQYVDQDASIGNLRAEEAQYLTILRRATTVKDMMVVSEKLSEVRGQIERQEAEFNALSRQIETVAIAISLRTESEAQVFGLNWRPGYQLKLALHDGLESVATYATAMTTVLFYLPVALLWVGTILIFVMAGWRMWQWVDRRWFGSKAITAAVQE